MAQTKGVNRTKADTPTSDNVLAPGTLGGRIRVMQDSYTFSGEIVTDTVLLFQDLKAGATILDVIIDNTTDTNATICDIGDSDTTDRYINGYTAQSVASSRGGELPATGRIAIGGVQYVIGTNTGDNKIILSVLGATSADAVAKFTLYYTED